MTAAPAAARHDSMGAIISHRFIRGSYISAEFKYDGPLIPPKAIMLCPSWAMQTPSRGDFIDATSSHWPTRGS